MTSPLVSSLLAHACWPHLRKCISVEAGSLLATGRKHRRLELHTDRFSDSQIAKVLGVSIGCAACGKQISPFRQRRRGRAGRSERPSRLFLALTCPLDQSIGCSRGRAATDAYEAVIRALQATARPVHATSGGTA